jgi:hypothetical protein
MAPNYTVFLWLLKLGALVNLYLLAHAGAVCAGRGSESRAARPDLFRRLALPLPVPGPVRTQRRIPRLHLLVDLRDATIRDHRGGRLHLPVLARAETVNVEQVGWVDGSSWLMVASATIAQVFVWTAVPDRAARAVLLRRARLAADLHGQRHGRRPSLPDHGHARRSASAARDEPGLRRPLPAVPADSSAWPSSRGDQKRLGTVAASCGVREAIDPW